MSSDRGPDALRRAELAAIHVAKKQLCLDDEAYRAMLWTVARVHSARDLDTHGRRIVLDHLRSRGFTGGARRQRPAMSRARMAAKVRALLAEAHRPDTYADAMARRMFGVDRFTWCDEGQLRKLIAALVYDAQRRQRKGAPA